MKTSRLLAVLLCSILAFPAFSQLDLKLQLMPDGTKWGVYVDPQPGVMPSTNTITGSGQITLVAPLNFAIIDLTPVSGNWMNNSSIHGPIENPTRSYISFGLVADIPQIIYSPTTATLLFTFKKLSSVCPDSLHLIDNDEDPFADFPNSVSTNPGNELTVFDIGTGGFIILNYGENIAPYAWDCHDCDSDGTPNALEDTNGDGEWTPGVDVSDLCNGAGGGCTAITAAQLQCMGGGTACGNNPSGPLALVVNITGGEAPFTVKYTDGSTITTLQGYQSGASFQVPATNGAVYELVEVIGADSCQAEPTDLSGEVPVTIVVPGALQFTTQPANTSVCPTASTSFEACASATNSSLSIRWEVSSNQGSSWQAVEFTSGIFSESTLSNGCKTLYVNNVTGLHGYQFRAVAEGDNAPSATSQVATLELQGPLQASLHPINVNVCAGEPAVFTASFFNNGGGDITYKWELSHDNGASWWDATQSANFLGVNTTTLTINEVLSSYSGDIFRLRARVGDCNFAYTFTAKLTVETEGCEGTGGGCEEITAAQIQCAGGGFDCGLNATGAIELEVNITGGQAPFLVKYSDGTDMNMVQDYQTGMPFQVPATPGAIYTLVAVVGNDGCMTTDSSDISGEVPVTLEEEGILSIVEHPENATVCPDESTSFQVCATASNSSLSIRWEQSADQGDIWQPIDLLNGIFAESDGNGGCKILHVNNVAGLHGYQFRAVAEGDNASASVSGAAELQVLGPLQASSHPSNVSICTGEPAVFTAAFDNLSSGDITYQWELSHNNGASWWNATPSANLLGANTTTMTINSVPQNFTGDIFRLRASVGTCDFYYTTAATLTVEPPVSFSQQPENTTICANEVASFSAAASGGNGLQLQWQSSDDGTIWADIAEGGDYTGTQTTTLTVHNANTARQYRLGATGVHCPTAYSTAATLTVEAPILFNQQPQSTVVCANEAASFSSTASGGSALQLQWQSSDDGTIWTDIAEGGNYTGTQTTTLAVESATATRQYRLGATGVHCPTAYSVAATLTVEAPIVFSQQPQDAVACADEATNFGITVSGGNGLQLQWQLSTNGTTWSDIAEGGIYSGTQTATLHVGAAAGLDGTRYRLVAASQSCTATSEVAALTLEDELICNPPPVYEDCVKLSIKLLANQQGWGVWAKADNDFTSTPYQLPTSGKVTIVAPMGFSLQQLTSVAGGKWKPGKVILNPAQDPGKIYIEFNLTPNDNFLNLQPGGEIMLFRFNRVGACPSSLVLMGNTIPTGFFPNQFAGFGAGDPDNSIVPFHFCGNYAQGQWQCPTGWNLMAPINEDDVANSTEIELDPSAVEIAFPVENEPIASYFGVAPNPTRDELTVSFEENITEKVATLRLWNLQGQLLLTERIEGVTNHRLDLGQAVPGTYFLTLEVDGKLVQREKIIVQ